MHIARNVYGSSHMWISCHAMVCVKRIHASYVIGSRQICTIPLLPLLMLRQLLPPEAAPTAPTAVAVAPQQHTHCVVTATDMQSSVCFWFLSLHFRSGPMLPDNHLKLMFNAPSGVYKPARQEGTARPLVWRSAGDAIPVMIPTNRSTLKRTSKRNACAAATNKDARNGMGLGGKWIHMMSWEALPANCRSSFSRDRIAAVGFDSLAWQRKTLENVSCVHIEGDGRQRQV